MNYHGQTALQTAVLVAFTQLIPEHQVQFFGAFSVRVKVTLFFPRNIPAPSFPCTTPTLSNLVRLCISGPPRARVCDPIKALLHRLLTHSWFTFGWGP